MDQDDDDSARADSATAGNEQRYSGRGNSKYTPQRNVNHKPFVVSSSSRSHHASTHSSQRSRRIPGLTEERLFAKAALRYAKNPGDAQALGKLASLLQKSGGGQSVDSRLVLEQVAGADGSQDREQVP